MILQKVIMVISSCRTLEQLEVAERYAYLYIDGYQDYGSEGKILGQIMNAEARIKNER